MTRNWFASLTGFAETSYDDTRARLVVEGTRLRSTVNGASYGIGTLDVPSLGELRARVATLPRVSTARLSVTAIGADVGDLHRDPGNRQALFQVASQFNLLEMTGPEVTPEDGVTRYAFDHTQGPACAIAAGAATIYRNYFAEVDGQQGQTAMRQIDCLRDLGVALGNEDGRLWTMRNGYALCSATGLETIAQVLASADEDTRDGLRARLRIGVHTDVQVTDGAAPDQHVSQAFCSALPVSYTNVPARKWESFARLVLDATYEATMWAAALNAARCGSSQVFLTRVGGGAFGNEPAWIDDAIRRALRLARDAGFALDVKLVGYLKPDVASLALARDFA